MRTKGAIGISDAPSCFCDNGDVLTSDDGVELRIQKRVRLFAGVRVYCAARSACTYQVKDILELTVAKHSEFSEVSFMKPVKSCSLIYIYSTRPQGSPIDTRMATERVLSDRRSPP